MILPAPSLMWLAAFVGIDYFSYARAQPGGYALRGPNYSKLDQSQVSHSVQQVSQYNIPERNVRTVHLAPGNYGNPSVIRTATGGLIYKIMVTLTVIAFLSNGAFLVYVFWY